jgi:hypothetical protein
MNEDLRIIQIIPISIAKDKLSLEDDLEKLINSDKPIGEKEVEIKGILKELVSLNEMLKLWTNYSGTEKMGE